MSHDKIIGRAYLEQARSDYNELEEPRGLGNHPTDEYITDILKISALAIIGIGFALLDLRKTIEEIKND